ncbi:MAG: hypothetical protein H9917_09120, partial [Candidatus Oceanisphaera merdipullorum]|nr:hypothetical protein [Candidatus Oceanisphaera merdipullorum]
MDSLTEPTTQPTIPNANHQTARIGFSLTPTRLVFLVSCYFFLVLNLALLAKLVGIVESLSDFKLGFILTIPV